MDKHHRICHEGEVVGFAKDKIVVKITSHSACAKCHASGVCSVADMSDKLIHCVTDRHLKVGEKVQVVMEEKMGWIAIFYAFILPFFLLMLVLFGLYFLGMKEEVAALAAVGSLAPYYGVLSLSRKRIEKDILFTVEKISG